MEDLLNLKKTLDELVALIEKNDYPGKDERTLGRIRFLVAQMGGRDSYISEKSSRIASQAAIFYSAKAARDQDLARALLTEITYDLPNRIRGQISDLIRHLEKRGEE